VPSENRASSEFDAKATSASRVKVNVRSTTRTPDATAAASGVVKACYGRLGGAGAVAGAAAAAFTKASNAS
jgi:hypothetical protein